MASPIPTIINPIISRLRDFTPRLAATSDANEGRRFGPFSCRHPGLWHPFP